MVMTLLEMTIFVIAGMAIEANFGVAKKVIEIIQKTKQAKEPAIPEKPKV